MVLCETKRNEMKSVLCEMKICTLRNENLYSAKWNLYFAKWKSVLCEMKSVLCEMKICTLRNEICTLRNEICTLRNENLYFAKWKSVLCEMKSVLCEMKSVLCEMKICTLRNENLYFAKWKSVHCEMKLLCEPTILLQSWPRHTFFLSRRHRRTSSRFFVDRDKAFLTWYLESADLENSERKPVKLRPSGCLEKLAPRKKTIFP